jgi:hypothetical protein
LLEPKGAEKYCTPKPNEEKTGFVFNSTDLEEDEDKSVFVSPLRAHKKRAPVADFNGSELTGTEDGSVKAKRGNKKMDSGRRTFREMVQEKQAMTTIANNKRLIKPVGKSKVRSTSDF